MGDPGGIGPEVIAKCLQNPDKFSGVFFLLIGASAVFEFLEEELRLRLPLNPIPTLHTDFLRDDSINFLDISEEAAWLLKNRSRGQVSGSKESETCPLEGLFDIGRVSPKNASLAMAALKAGAYQGATGLVDALVTAPVNKETMRLVEPKFEGHTEYLAAVAKAKPYAMMFIREETPETKPFRVTLATIHVPLKKVSRLITRQNVLEKIRLTHQFLKEKLRISKPKIGVAALNPHGHETGDEEEKEIVPALKEAAKEGISVTGPISGDRIFYEIYQEQKFDAVVSMYHDQALAPFKMVAFDTGVNLTLGLPYIRTSPDHGTAFDIAYRGKADSRSMESALRVAVQLVTKS
jgi:4-hydroxythreonine-4-phosphate dehydrogenase